MFTWQKNSVANYYVVLFTSHYISISTITFEYKFKLNQTDYRDRSNYLRITQSDS